MLIRADLRADGEFPTSSTVRLLTGCSTGRSAGLVPRKTWPSLSSSAADDLKRMCGIGRCTRTCAPCRRSAARYSNSTFNSPRIAKIANRRETRAGLRKTFKNCKSPSNRTKFCRPELAAVRGNDRCRARGQVVCRCRHEAGLSSSDRAGLGKHPCLHRLGPLAGFY